MRLKFVISVIVLGLFIVGCQGPAGPAGPQGNPGPSGAQGSAGLSGPEGPAGPQGEKGDDGDAGATGETGPTGPLGPQGVQGELGEKGDRGSIGARGPSGAAGVQGPVGMAGGDFGTLFSNDLNIRDHVVWVDAGSSNGSGIVIGNGELITAEHVISGKSLVSVSIPGVGLVSGVVKGYDKTRDIALLTFSSTGNEQVAQLSSGPVWDGSDWSSHGQQGSPVVAIGFVTAISNTAPMTSFGHIATRWNIIPGEISKLGVDAEVTSGMSGGGVFDVDGGVVGMIQTKSSHLGSDNRALSYQEIEEVLPELRAGAQNP